MGLIAKSIDISSGLSVLLVLASCGGGSGTMSAIQTHRVLSSIPEAISLVHGGESEQTGVKVVLGRVHTT